MHVLDSRLAVVAICAAVSLIANPRLGSYAGDRSYQEDDPLGRSLYIEQNTAIKKACFLFF
ncbi:hypothetical protein GCM10009504_30380 [Pseudomonas laurentiana]|nr:hypothetical protein GCM10009504_30380 [Pseudomonas laurentiana]